MGDDRMKMPKMLKAFLYCYIGAYPIVMHFSQGSEIPLLYQILILTIGSFFFSYGVICFVLDIKKGGLKKIIDKIKQFYKY